MSALVPISHVQIVLKNLNPLEVAAIEAGKGMKIKDYGLENLFSRISNIVKEAVQIRGEKMAELDQGKLTQLLTEELKQSFSTFTVEEIGQAVHAWAAGKIYEEGKHVSVHNICKSIWHWRDIIKREAIHKMEKEKEAQEKEQTEEEKQAGREKFRELLTSEFEYWKQNKTLLHSGPQSRAWHAYLYLWFKERGYSLPNDEAMEVKDKADKVIQRDRAVKQEHKAAHLLELEEKRKELAREMALPIVFEKLVKFGIKLEDIK